MKPKEKIYYLLNEDINSIVKKGYVYGRKGDKVLLIAKMDDVFIVEHCDDKSRFPVKKKYLNIIKPTIQTTLF